MADNERLLNIVDALLDKPHAAWGAAGGEKYHTDSGEYRLTIASEDGDGAPPYKFSIRRKGSGVELESISMSDAAYDTAEYVRTRDGLTRLFALARRRALGVDEAIADVERNLGLA